MYWAEPGNIIFFKVRGNSMNRRRCSWCGEDPLYVEYHDHEWGVPVHDDTRLFEMLVLEGAQAGLSWITILRKREQYRLAFDFFDYRKVAQYSEAAVEQLLVNPGIVRNRLKIESAIKNSRAMLNIISEYGSFSTYLWRYVDGRPIQNNFQCSSDLPSKSPISINLSKDLKKRGFSFVGPTVCYAFMQSIGMVNDHLTGCYRHAELQGNR